MRGWGREGLRKLREKESGLKRGLEVMRDWHNEKPPATCVGCLNKKKMSYSVIEKGKKFISDQPYLHYYTGTPDYVIEHYTHLEPIDAKILNENPDIYSGDYFFKEIELGEKAISVTFSMVKNVPTGYQRVAY